MAFHDLATSCVMEQAELGVVVMSLLLLCVLVVPLSFAIAAIVSNLDDIAVWAKNLATFKLAPPPVWLASLPLVGAKAVELWDRIAAAGIQDATVRVAAICGWRD